MFDHLKILWHQGKQFIPNVQTAQVPGPFKGRPVITTVEVDERELVELCPMLAINTNPLSIDLGKCSFCGECAAQYPQKISFTKDYHLSTNRREDLIVVAGVNEPITLDSSLVRKEIKRVFGRSLKLRQVSAGGDGSCELELNATNNVQFDISRFGIDFVASPRHADGLLVTGPITENMALALEKAYDATPEPKILILCGVDAISGGLYAESNAINRSFLEKVTVDLYIPGNPPHPLTIINGLLDLIKSKG
ncbi:MAG: hypothetical protein KBG80_06785 [Breznakibacter sp.]|nr:hypothetical protein [Breznakibacter sp.]